MYRPEKMTETIYRIDLKTGKPRWQREIPEGVATNILEVGGAVVAVTLSDKTLALDLGTGELLWSYPEDAPEKNAEYRGEHFQWTASPATDGKRIFVGRLDGRVAALDPKDGRPKWQTDLGARVSAHPTLASGYLYVGTADGVLHRLSARNGKSVAQMDLGTAPMWQITPIPGGVVVLLEGAETFVAADEGLSRELWRATTAGTWTSFRPVLWRQVFLAGDSEGDLHALDPTNGRSACKKQIGGELRGLGQERDVLYVGNLDGMIRAWRPPGDVPGEGEGEVARGDAVEDR